MTDSCDVAVIGGGPGGSAVATFLVDSGFDVVLLERARFPREHVGESLLPASIPILEQIGALPTIEAAGFLTKPGATMVWDSDPEPLELVVAHEN
jgi:2-polyprenyl-6-methoxyphenol hydroxylase-like FAD-dependent oxidoreductase